MSPRRPWPSAPPGPLAALRLGTRSEGDLCEAPDGRAGVCRVIRDCPAMLALLEGRPSQENIIVLNRARCGFQGSVPVVCCAGSQSTARPPTPRPGGGGGGGGGSSPVSDDVDSVARDVSNHPNLRMLPQEVCGPVGTDRITGGTVADIYAYPWIARLGYKSSTRPNNPVSYRCGGSLISSRYVLTAAHCVVMRKESPLRLTTVKLGEHTTDTPVDCKESGSCLPPPVDVEVEQIVVHPGYDAARQPPTMHHDLALLRLARPVDFAREEFVRPVCLPVGADNQRMRLDGEALVVAGWGTTETGEGSKALLNVFVPAVPIDRCRDAYRKALVAGSQGRVQFGVVSLRPRNCGRRRRASTRASATTCSDAPLSRPAPFPSNAAGATDAVRCLLGPRWTGFSERKLNAACWLVFILSDTCLCTCFFAIPVTCNEIDDVGFASDILMKNHTTQKRNPPDVPMFRVSSLHRTRSSSPGNWPPGRPHLASGAVPAAAAAASGRFSVERARGGRPVAWQLPGRSVAAPPRLHHPATPRCAWLPANLRTCFLRDESAIVQSLALLAILLREACKVNVWLRSCPVTRKMRRSSESAQPGARLSYNCAGTLIAERYVLTAAHCVVRRTSQVVSVRLGEYNTATPIDCKELQFQPQRQACLPPPIDVDVQHIVTHPDYNRATSYHDIALLQLAWPVDFVREEFVRPVCLPAAADLQNFALDGKKLVAAGWGTADLETGQGSEVLLDVVVPAVGLQQCQEAYRRGRDSCTGDSGGPLMREALVAGEAKTVQFGVVSFGPRSCGTAGVPGVYTRVGHYMQWILDTMRP
ncbi:Serine protease grass [Gryllus bimaculatus]|nr:Serine protease grass [Gryllus bimaculatus]